MFQDGFPDFLSDDVAVVVGLLTRKPFHNVTNGVSEETIQYYQDHKVIRFPYRIYYDDLADDVLGTLSLRQQMIMHCIYSRNCDGFVRQKHMNSLLHMDYEDWAIPYIVKICDEYVLEVVEMAYDILKEQDTERIKRFCYENIVQFCKSYNRMISYWNEFYRFKHTNFQNYIGRHLFRECFGYSRSMERRAKEISKTSHIK